MIPTWKIQPDKISTWKKFLSENSKLKNSHLKKFLPENSKLKKFSTEKNFLKKNPTWKESGVEMPGRRYFFKDFVVVIKKKLLHGRLPLVTGDSCPMKFDPNSMG